MFGWTTLLGLGQRSNKVTANDYRMNIGVNISDFSPLICSQAFPPELTTLDCVSVFSFSHFPTISKLYAAFARSSCFCFAHDVWT